MEVSGIDGIDSAVNKTGRVGATGSTHTLIRCRRGLDDPLADAARGQGVILGEPVLLPRTRLAETAAFGTSTVLQTSLAEAKMTAQAGHAVTQGLATREGVERVEPGVTWK